MTDIKFRETSEQAQRDYEKIISMISAGLEYPDAEGRKLFREFAANPDRLPPDCRTPEVLYWIEFYGREPN